MQSVQGLHAHRAAGGDGHRRAPCRRRHDAVRHERDPGQGSGTAAKTCFKCAKRSIEYYADKQKYPSSLDALVSEKYLREIKADPFTLSVETWQTTMSEPDAANPSAETGIYNVKSGAPGTGSDGRPYSEW